MVLLLVIVGVIVVIVSVTVIAGVIAGDSTGVFTTDAVGTTCTCFSSTGTNAGFSTFVLTVCINAFDLDSDDFSDTDDTSDSAVDFIGSGDDLIGPEDTSDLVDSCGGIIIDSRCVFCDDDFFGSDDFIGPEDTTDLAGVKTVGAIIDSRCIFGDDDVVGPLANDDEEDKDDVFCFV